jgi:hypothetical protein
MNNDYSSLGASEVARLNSFIANRGMDKTKFVDIIERLGRQTPVAGDILDAISSLVYCDEKKEYTAAGLSDLLKIIHPLVYGEDVKLDK